MSPCRLGSACVSDARGWSIPSAPERPQPRSLPRPGAVSIPTAWRLGRAPGTKPGGAAGTSSGSFGSVRLQTGRGSPAAPQVQPRSPTHGRSGWFSQTHRPSSQRRHRTSSLTHRRGRGLLLEVRSDPISRTSPKVIFCCDARLSGIEGRFVCSA